MIGTLIVWFMFFYIFALAGGMLLAKFTWTHTGQGWRK